MKILLLGGTGAMGVHLVKLLSVNGFEIFVTSRKYKNPNGNVTYIQGNACDLDFLQKLLKEDWDVIVDFMVYSTPQFNKRIKLLLKRTTQYIFLSSARVYADSDKTITERSSRLLDVSTDQEYLSTDEYALSKARQENILKNTIEKNWTIIRPYITYSENRLQLGVLEKEEWLYRALKGRTIVFSEDINSKLTTLTYGYDVAKAIISVIGNSKALGQVFQITTNESNTWSFILKIYLDLLENHLDYKPKVLLQNLDQYNNIETFKEYQIKYDRLFNRQFNNSKIRTHFNDTFTPLNIGLRNSLETFLKNPMFKNINWKAEALKDKQTKEHASLKEIPSFKQKIKYLLYRHII